MCGMYVGSVAGSAASPLGAGAASRFTQALNATHWAPSRVTAVLLCIRTLPPFPPHCREAAAKDKPFFMQVCHESS